MIVDKSGIPFEYGMKSEQVSDGAISIDMLANRSTVMTESKAMKIEAFYACVRDKAETIGQLPLKLYQAGRNSRTQVMQGRTHRIFTKQPCDYLTMQGFLEMLVVSYETNGAFYAYIERNDKGQPMSLIPFDRQRSVVPGMDTNGHVYYTYTTNDGKPVMYAHPDDLFIISMFTLDGYTPIRPIQAQARLLGTAESQDESYKEMTEQGIMSQMALKTDQMFDNANAAQRLREDMKKTRGPMGAKHIPIFEQGLTPISLKISPKDAELLGSKQFTVNRICRMTRVPPHRVGVDTGKNATATVSELDEAYMRDSLNPILCKVEAAFDKLTPDGNYVEFNRKAFYAGSPWRLVEAVEREVKGGLASVNEGRIDLGRETVAGGDIFAIDNNNVTYGLWTEVKQIQEQLYGQANQQTGDKPVNDNQEQENEE